MPLFVSTACARVELGNDVLWSADLETGDLSQWSVAPGGGSHVDVGSSVAASTRYAHSGNYSAELLASAAPEHVDDGPGLQRAFPAAKEAYYSVWYYLPVAYTSMNTTWTIQKFESLGVETDDASVDTEADAGPDAGDDAGADASSDAGIMLREHLDLNLRPLPGGQIVLEVFGHTRVILQPPLAIPPPEVPIGRWFQIEAFYRPAADDTGRFVVWLDGRQVYDIDKRPTSAGDDIFWMPCNIATGLTPSPPVIYVDDAAISHTRVTPNGILK